MCKIVKKLFLVLVLLWTSTSSSNEILISSLKDNDKLIFIRHSYAPGNGDPDGFSLKDCSSQRNLNDFGIEYSKKIYKFFSINNIPIDQILSSEWCRCRETAEHAFGKYKTFKSLNSFYDKKFAKNKDKQIKELREYMTNWNGDKNIVFITHFIVILELLDVSTSSGEIIIVDNSFKIIGNIILD